MTGPIAVYVGPRHDIVHTSKVLAGFSALVDRGEAAVTLARPKPGDAWLVADPVVVCFDVEGSRPMRVALDLRDGEGFSYPIRDRVAWYFKRAWYRPEVEALPPEMGRKVLPFGLNYGCRTWSSTWRFLRTVGGPIAREGLSGFQRLRQLLAVPTPPDFEQGPDAPVEPAVAFQTRLWTADEIVPAEVEPLNTERVAMVRALRKAFGRRFVGGLVPTAYAMKHFPDDLTPHPSKYATYLAVKKRCLIGVYTRGVEHSLAFKLGETFAASQCLVSVALRYETPSPIEPGRHYLPFTSIDECVAACEALLGDPARAAGMRRENHAYYLREVEPAAHIRRVLERLGVA
jgi:hypothetical protein